MYKWQRLIIFNKYIKKKNRTHFISVCVCLCVCVVVVLVEEQWRCKCWKPNQMCDACCVWVCVWKGACGSSRSSCWHSGTMSLSSRQYICMYGRKVMSVCSNCVWLTVWTVCVFIASIGKQHWQTKCWLW